VGENELGWGRWYNRGVWMVKQEVLKRGRM
jgi:hypothetical protein